MKEIKIVALLCLLAFSATAQYRGGIEVGGNIMGADLTLENPLEPSRTWGIRIGYVAEYQLIKNLHVRSGIFVDQRGFKLADERWGLNVIDLPINVGYNANIVGGILQLFIDAGINLDYNFHAFTKIDDELVRLGIGSSEEDIKALSAGYNIGAGVMINRKFKLRLNYYNGLTNLVRTSRDEWKNQVFGLSLDFFFGK